MSLLPLATPDQLAALLQQPLASNDPSALLLLTIATGMVRDELHQDISQSVNDVQLMDPVNAAFVFLDQMPVTNVSLVETFGPDLTASTGTPYVWTTADPTTYTVSRRLGIIAGKPGLGISWPSNPESWRVTYTHGYPIPPDSLVGVVLGVAARAWTVEPGVDMEHFGPRTVKYHMEAGGFTALELRALAAYTYPRAA